MQALDATAARAVVPRPAATTLILRDGAQGAEMLMVRRSPNASFMPGAYVFPGGAVDAADALAHEACDESTAQLAARIGAVTGVGDAALAYAVAALRECLEECGLWLGDDAPGADLAALRARLHGGAPMVEVASHAALPLRASALQPWSHWVTPLGVPKRFDTLFFAVRAPAGQQPTVDAGETTTLAWVRPEQAMAQHAQGAFPMEFATVSTVRSLLPLAPRGVQALLDHAGAQRSLKALHPRLVLDASRRVLGIRLPGDDGYDALDGD
ncbi:MAG: NUDIX domain-containing protein [Burkholderiaceae bacterium]